MPLFSEHITNMYYSGSPSYSAPYSYSSSMAPYGSSYSASYLNPGGNYSSHSSLGGYSRTPLPSRWISSSRTYSPILSTISEKGTSSPVRINSPRRAPISSRSYISSTYIARPININTADIDVSRDKYRNKISSTNLITTPPRRPSPKVQRDNDHDKPDTGIDSSPGPQRTTIKRDRAVVRLHTIKRKDRDSPRKPMETKPVQNNNNIELSKRIKCEEKSEPVKWREKLADDLTFKVQKEKKSIGAKLVEKFTLKDKDNESLAVVSKQSPPKKNDENICLIQPPSDESAHNKLLARRCSMELLAEQASLFDSLIRRENLSTALLDLSKVGTDNVPDSGESIEKKRKLSKHENPLATTKSDHSLHDNLQSKEINDLKHSKRRSLRKCSSGGSICKLDCISEVPSSTTSRNLLHTKETKIVNKKCNKNLKPKIKTKITSTVEVTTPTTPLKLIVEQVTVEEKPRICKKGIIFSSTVDDIDDKLEVKIVPKSPDGHRMSIKCKKSINQSPKLSSPEVELSTKDFNIEKEEHRKSIKVKPVESPEPEDGNFWNKIGKRETIYLIKRKQNIEENMEKNKRSLFWFPENDEPSTDNVNKNEKFTDNEDILKVIEPEKRSDEEAGTISVSPSIADKICENKKQSEINEQIKESELLKTSETEKIQINDNKDNISSIKNTDYSKNKTQNILLNLISNENKETKLIKNDLSVKHESSTPSENLSQELIESVNQTAFEVKDREPRKEPNIKESKTFLKNMTSNIERNTENEQTLVGEFPDKSESKKSHKNAISIESKKNEYEKVSPVKIQKAIETSKELNKNESYRIEKACNHFQLAKKESKKDHHLVEDVQSNIDEVVSETNNKSVEFNVCSEPNNFKTENNKCDLVDIKNLDTKKENQLKNEPKKNSLKTNNSKPSVDVKIDKDPKVRIIESNVNSNEVSLYKNIQEIDINKTDIYTELGHKNTFENRTAPLFKDEGPNVNDIHKTLENKNIVNKKLVSPVDRKENNKEQEVRDRHELEDKSLDSKSIPDNNDQKNISIQKDIKVKSNKVINTVAKDVKEDKTTPSPAEAVGQFVLKKPVKEEKAPKILIATPRPLQKRKPQVIHTTSSSSSSDDESSDGDDDDSEELESSESSAEFLECENNTDGRTSTGSNDSGFDSSAPTSPSSFVYAKKGKKNKKS